MPATKANLEKALKDIGSTMDKDKQFILFVTDHGDLDGERAVRERIQPNTIRSFSVDEPALQDMLRNPSVDPGLTLMSLSDTSIRKQLENIQEIAINGIDIVVGGSSDRSFFDIFQESSFESIPGEFLYQMDFSKTGLLGDLKASLMPDNQVLINYGDGDSWQLESIRLSSGAIPRITVPGPATLALLAIGFLVLVLSAGARSRAKALVL